LRPLGSGATDITGASATVDGVHGLVIKPVAGDNLSHLSGDGTWRSKRPKLGYGTSGTYFNNGGGDVSINAGLVPPWSQFSSSNVQNFAARAHFIPYHTECPFSLTKVRYYVSANANANPAKIAAYTASRSTGLPETRIGTAETVAVDSAAMFEVTLGAAKSIPAGWFWIGFVATSTTNMMCIDCKLATSHVLSLITGGLGDDGGVGSGVISIDASYAEALPSSITPSSSLRLNSTSGSYFGGSAPWIVLK